MLPKEVQNSPPLEDVSYRLKGFRENTTAGKQIPNFIFSTPDSKVKDLLSIKAKYKLIVFWASWCAPCLAEIPVLDSLYKEHKNAGLKILSINVDNSPILWKKNIPKYTFDCEHLYQGGYSSSLIYKYFNVTSIPFMILLNAENKILKYNIQINEVAGLLKQ
jgi:thiol-disulfide isomerase/thioredoxin